MLLHTYVAVNLLKDELTRHENSCCYINLFIYILLLSTYLILVEDKLSHHEKYLNICRD